MEEQRILANRYQLISKIGNGGMAVVYKAYDRSLDRQVAVKLLRDEYADDPDFIRQFQKEAKAVARLSHQNIVHIFDFGESDGLNYLVMEYVEGYTLKYVINHYGPLPLNQLLDYSIQLCNGMAEAHNQKIVHKDIKPHNILIDRNHVVKVTDFGIAQATNNLTITHNKGILGSAHYFSPEQARGDYVDYKSDIYSLGIVMYEMATGHVPFTGENPVTVALKHMQEPPASLLAQRPELPAALEQIIFRALEKNPAHRFQSMQEMANALTSLQGGSYTAMERSVESEYATYQAGETISHHKADWPNPQDAHTRIMNHDYLQQERQSHSEEQQKKTGGVKKLLLGLVAAVVLFFGSYTAVQSFLSNDEVAVPDLTEKTILEAEALLSQAGLKIVVEDEIFDDDVAEGQIISQLPKAETMVKEGREITVTVSLGSNSEAVPDLTGMTSQQAKIALENEGLKLGMVVEQTTKDQPNGLVFHQSIAPDTEVMAGTTVDIMISKLEQASVTMPTLTGKAQSEAKKALEAAGLLIGTIQQASSTEYISGIVLRQGIPAGTRLEPGTAVDMTVSNGPGPASSAQLELIIPEDGRVVARIRDNRGTNVLFERDCVAGERIQSDFLYYGNSTVTITCNDKEIWSREYAS